jgi:uncharacterized membrane protein
MMNVIWALIFLGAPALLIYATVRFPFLDRVGAIVLAYGVGLVIGNIGVLPDSIGTVQDAMTTFTVPLALPLIFFSLDLRSWRKLARPGLLSLLAATIAVAAGSLLTYFIFRSAIGEEGWKAAGMLVGVYTGGTPNLASIGNALQVDPETYVSVHGSDVIVGAVLLALIVSVFPRVLRRVLPAYQENGGHDEDGAEFGPRFSGWSRPELGEMGLALLAAVVIFAIGGSLTLFLPDLYGLPAAMLVITSLGIAASFHRRIRSLRNSFQLGYYLVLVFSLTVSSMANVSEIADTAPIYILYVAALLGIISLLHLGLSALFRVDRDTHLIAATSFIYSPPFVPVVAAAIGNRKVIVTGVVLGVIGWIAGNYLGFGLAFLLRAFG